jgi:PAS domain S-box-containing protein
VNCADAEPARSPRPRRPSDMESQPEPPGEEIKRLQRCINDLIGVVALPAIWRGRDPAQLIRTLLEVLLGMLRLDLIYVQLNDPGHAPSETLRVSHAHPTTLAAHEICGALKRSLGPHPEKSPQRIRNPIGEGDISIMTLSLGLQGEIGIIVAASLRPDFPGQTERLLLSVAANQAAIGLQEAMIVREQKRVAGELDRRVAQRTRELAAANETLKKEIAERKLSDDRLHREERELKRSEARKTAILNSALDCIVTIDHDGCVTEFNPAAERTFGYKREAVLGEKLSGIIIPPSLRGPHERGLARYLATGEAPVIGRRLEMIAMRADGSEFPVELAITRIPSDGPPSFTGYLRDITERRRSEQELRRSEAFLAEAQRVSSTGSFSWRVAADEFTWSDELYRIFEVEPAVPVTLRQIATRVHPEDMPSMLDVIERARASGNDFEHDHRLQMPDQSVKYLHMVAHCIRDAGGQLEYIGAIQDVTQRRVAEQALGKARSELAHVARVTSLGALTASIAHEVNQPLSGIVTNASTCLRMLAADPPNIEGARETARRTLRDGNRASEVIKRLRALFAKRGSSIESLDLNEAAREVIALSLSEFQRNRVILQTELAEDLPPVVGDRVQLQQVILNLLLNAADAMSGVEDRPRHLVTRTEREADDRVRLSVKDTGVGFEPQGVDRLFEAFYTTKNNGMGIGLSVSRSIIEGHRGRLWAVSNEGPGATFSFSIPHASAGMAATYDLGAIRIAALNDAQHIKYLPD